MAIVDVHRLGRVRDFSFFKMLDNYSFDCTVDQVLTAHRRWQAYRGNRVSDDLIFTAKKSSLVQVNGTEIDVFLAANTKEESCDFKVKGRWSERSCTIYAGNSTTVIAQIYKDHKAQSVLGQNTFGITVYPNVDYALVIALVVILQEMNEDKHSSCTHP